MSERLNLPSASSFHMDVACPGRQNLLRELRGGAPVEIDDPALLELAARGSRIHQARANGGHTLHLKDDGEVAAYKQACDLEKQVVDDWRAEHGITDLSDPVVEERLWLHREDTLEPILSGQFDAIYLAGQHACIPDWKTSTAANVETATRNWQTRNYALLAWKEWPQLTRIRVALIMPEKFGTQTDVADFTEYDLGHVEQAVRHALWLSDQPDAQLNAGAHCRFCAARGQCPAAAKMATLPAVTGNGDPLALVRAMPVADLAAVWKRRNQINAIFDAITLRLSALSGEELDAIGLKKTAGRKLDTIRDVAGAYAWLRRQGIPDGDLLCAMSFGKGKLVKLIATAWNVTEEAAEKLYDGQLDEFIERGRAKPSLVEST